MRNGPLALFLLLIILPSLFPKPRSEEVGHTIVVQDINQPKITLGFLIASPSTSESSSVTSTPARTLSPPPDQGMGYLIVTRRMFVPHLENFVRWKENLGYSVTVITVEDNIENHYGGRDIPERIRNCIRDYYENSGVRWVLLVGDADPADGPPKGGSPNYQLDNDWEVPIRYVWNPDNVSDDTGHSENWNPSDLYYAGLDGDWDNYLGENLFRFPDWEAEVYVGRLPVRSVDELLVILNKTINYLAPSKSFLNIGARLSTNAGRLDDEGVVWAKENVRRQAMQKNLVVHSFYDLSPSCYSISVSRDGRRIGVGTSQSGRFYLFDNSENVPRMTFLAEHEVVAVALAKDENWSAIGTNTGTIFFFENFDNRPVWYMDLGKTVKSLRLSNDGRVGAVLAENTLLVFNNSGESILGFENDQLLVMDLSENGQLVVAAGGKWIRLWQDGTPKWTYENSELVGGFTTVSISPSGIIVVGGYKGENAVIATFGVADNPLRWAYTEAGKIGLVQASGGYILATVEGRDNLVLYFNENENVPLWQCSLDRPATHATLSGNGAVIAFSVPYQDEVNPKPCEVFILDNENRLLCRLVLENMKGTRTPGKVYALSMPENGEWLAIGAFENLLLISPEKVLWSFDPRVFPPITRELILETINSFNPTFINSYSHGGIRALYYVKGGGPTPFMDGSTENSLSNRGFLQVSFACLSAAVDASSQCLGENLLLAPNRGAVAYIGATRPMWVSENAGCVRELDQEFWRIFLNHPSLPYRPGPALYGAIAFFVQNYPEYDPTWEQWKNNLLSLILLGDPELHIFPLPRPPLLLFPPSGENRKENRVRLGWLKTEPLDENFRLFLDNRPDFPNPIVIELSENCWEGELSEGTWYWRVQAVDFNGEAGENSETRWFTIDMTTPSILWIRIDADFYSATITWEASEPVYGSVFLDGRAFNTSLGIRHSVQIRNLSPGTTYTCTITVHDPAGNVSSSQRSFTTPRPNSPPTAGFSFSPSTPRENEPIFFLDTSHDSDGSIVRWHWEFGDGKTSSERNPVHAFEREGRYTVSLTVWDDKGASTTTRKVIEVIPLNLPPAASFTYWPADPNTRDEIVFDASSSYDPDGTIVTFLWDFGDNSTAEGRVVRHLFSDPGLYQVKLRVLDNGGKWSERVENLMITNPPPAPSVAELMPQPLENICWILLRSEPQSSGRVFELLPLWQRASVVRLAENSLQKMVDVLRFADPEKTAETLRLTSGVALPLLRLLLHSDPALTALILRRGPSQLLENFPIPEVLTVLRHADNLNSLFLALSREKKISVIGELVRGGDFETIEKILAPLPTKLLVELWNSLDTETRNLILPHLSEQTKERLQTKIPAFVFPLVCVVLAALGVALFRWMKR